MEKERIRQHSIISDYDGEYLIYVSEFGTIYTIKWVEEKGKWKIQNLREIPSNDGYSRVDIRHRCYMVSRLVAETWLPMPVDFKHYDYEVHHIDGNRANNRKENLYFIKKKYHKTLHCIKSVRKLGDKEDISNFTNFNLIDICGADRWFLEDLLEKIKNNNAKKLQFNYQDNTYEVAV